ncbi:response regulator transcription factor [Sphingomonas aerophila]|jgi:DNA-binding CsgD family transcriptional regulator|uniref:DNA-binding CsgD family transcriptional regulator n=1 Tax=Sphingomonas aerophila TaxID=1344948 RepID=A0A7W9B9S9_9SPHN|nr:helix-turn-helix transcriptional regulator [Sphingomonas aerophila]MBB5713266.1 DNA-binding CsgD family transcriptional regulator [Sphingomonas aerophila]
MIAHPAVHLTAREGDVLRMVGAGRSSKQIAAALGIAPKTVETYIEHIKLKMGATNRSHMAALAVAWGLLDLNDGPDAHG